MSVHIWIRQACGSLWRAVHCVLMPGTASGVAGFLLFILLCRLVSFSADKRGDV